MRLDTKAIFCAVAGVAIIFAAMVYAIIKEALSIPARSNWQSEPTRERGIR